MDNSILKFRVWYNGDYSLSAFCNIDMNGNVWLADTDGANECDFINITDKCTVERSTGLKDKNGNLIYERDIIRFCSNRQGYILAYEKAVIWDDDKKGFIVQSTKQQGKPALKWSLPDPETHIIEIIGNVHTEEQNHETI